MLAGWLCHRFGATGFLYWESTYWRLGDPYEELKTERGAWGDGMLFFPGVDGPLDTVRAEFLRIGIEDYEFLATLDDLIKKCDIRGIVVSGKIRELTDSSDLIEGMRKYERDGSSYTQRRRKIIQALVLLVRELDKANAKANAML